MNKDYKKTEIKEIDLKNVNGGCITTFVKQGFNGGEYFSYLVTKEKLDAPQYKDDKDFGKDAKLFTDLKEAQKYADQIKVSKDGNTYFKGLFDRTYQKK